ncbi:MAG: hypothetical protein A3K83_02120 [Omnitrophica WOR_2 bacterium RBG_13_44_8b]|nr:MAG: hypothetical protein A3K83_02120 [Omnitrophica WOR_2 bacterium RBG_13_44_8b]
MNKEDLLNEFLKGLRIIMNCACAYNKEHPYFIKSTEAFKQKLDLLLRVLRPVRIDITADSLFIDGKHWQKPAMYQELAVMMHMRKIKTVEFKEGVTLQELIDFLSAVAQPIKEILRQGGLKNILSQYASSHTNTGGARICVEDLDYSRLLHEEGEDSKDVWSYLFKQAVEKNDRKEINAFADDFGKIIGRFNAKELFEDEELRQNLHNFLCYLKDHQKEKFYKCSRDLLKSASKFKQDLTGGNIDKMKSFFQGCNEDEFANLLWNGITTEENFDIFSFKLFSQLADEEKHKKIADSLLNKVADGEPFKNNKKAVKNIQNLLVTSDAKVISEVYRNTLSTLLSRVSFDEGLTFDADVLRMNYRFALFNLFEADKNRERLNLILDPMLKECNNIIKDRNLEHLRIITDIIDKKLEQDASMSGIFEGLEKCIADFVENACFETEVLAGLEYFIDRAGKVYQRFDFYFEKVFNEKIINTLALRVILRFFPRDLPYVYEHLGKRRSDIDFLVKIVKGLEGINTPQSLEMLKQIYYLANTFVKIEVLKSMQNSSTQDEEFLFSVLKEPDPFLKKEAVAILGKSAACQKKLFQELLSIPSPLGRKNKLILENLNLIESLDYRQAQEYLEALAARPYFWNRFIRNKARQILSKWKC